jgi:hypothetical protein
MARQLIFVAAHNGERHRVENQIAFHDDVYGGKGWCIWRCIRTARSDGQSEQHGSRWQGIAHRLGCLSRQLFGLIKRCSTTCSTSTSSRMVANT